MGAQTVRQLVVLFCVIFVFVQSELLQVHIVFRHGERTPDNFVMFPTDPYINETFYPYGPGQLTNEGKRTMYSFGKQLRKRYDEFIGELYQPNLIDAWSSSMDRCKVSLETVLASLFPPKGILVWDENLNWQPIPYNFLPRKYDNLFLGIVTENYIKEYNRYYLTGEGKKITDEKKTIFSYVQTHTNSTIRTLRDLYMLHLALSGEDAFGLALPEWTKKIYPQPLGDLVLLEYKLQVGTKSLKRQIVGRLLKKIFEDSENRIKYKSSNKLHLYSGHDMTIAWVLISLDLMYNHHPGYATCLALELHEENGSHFIEAHYKDDKHSSFKLLPFPNGEKRFYFHQFRKMVQELFKDDEEEGKSNAASGSSETQGLCIYSLIIITLLLLYEFTT